MAPAVVVAVAPVATVSATTQISTSSAALNGSVHSQGLATTYRFEWGTGANYGNVTEIGTVTAGDTPQSVQVALSQLAANTTYHFRLVASNTDGEGASADAVFTTAASFELVALPNSGPLSFSAAAWGDYDADGDLDFAAFGSRFGDTFEIWKNNGAAGFSLTSKNGRSSGSLAWGDYDHDGDLDLLATGQQGSSTSAILQAPAFSGINFGPYTLRSSTAFWGDYDLDGSLDVILAGADTATGEGATTGIWHNDGNSTFSRIALPGVPQIYLGTATWADYDNDGDLDFALCGRAGLASITQLWRNEGAGGFIQQPLPGVPGVIYGFITWADIDSDGDLDFFLNGEVAGGTSRVANIWRNDGVAGFSEVLIPGLPGLTGNSVAFADYDGDGDMDFAIAGRSHDGGTHVQLRRNDGEGVFTEVPVIGLLPFQSGGALAWGDYNGDNALDLLAVSSNGTQIFRNTHPVNPATPSAPTGLTSALQADGTAILSWDGATDATTPSAALTYNLRAGSSPGAIDIVVPMSAASGYRRFPAAGNRGSRLSTVIRRPAGTTFYWSVQTVNSRFVGSAFAAEQSVTTPPRAPAAITAPATPVEATTARLQAQVNCNAADTTVRFEWGATAGLGNSTAPQNLASGNVSQAITADITGLSPGDAYYFRVIAANAHGTTTGEIATFSTSPFDVPGTALNLVGRSGEVEWGDFDSDGDLDFYVSGIASPSGMIASQLWRNDGGGSFVVMANPGISTSLHESFSWGDFDRDGDLDFLATGPATEAALWRQDGLGSFAAAPNSAGLFSGGEVLWGDYDNDGDLDAFVQIPIGLFSIPKLWRNDGNSGFEIITPTGGPTGTWDSFEWVDYDNDGDLDICVAGNNNTRIFRNEGDAVFSLVPIGGLPGIGIGEICWADYDGDGDLDFFVTGQTGTGGVCQLWRNNGLAGFANAPLPNVPSVGSSTAAWGDYDNDGDFDLCFMGSGVFKLLRNDGLAGFLEVATPNMSGFAQGHMVWGDGDNDGDLDLLRLGGSGTKVIRNALNRPNTVPTAPANLASVVDADGRVTLSWDAAADLQTPPLALTYNLRVGTSPGGGNVVTPMSAASGYRRVAQLGNLQHGTTGFLKNLPSGMYFWSVQAVDTAYAGGPFGAEGSFYIPTAVEAWREKWFNSQANAGNAADSADPDGDGQVNLVEFATGRNPTANETAPVISALLDSGGLFLSYTRAKTAVKFLNFRVEWADEVVGPWDSAGVVESIQSEDALVQNVRASVPIGGNDRRFLRLRITYP